MKLIIKKGILHVACVLSLMMLIKRNANAQFIPYSQYDNTPLLINPASAALKDYTELSVHYRRSRISNYNIPSVSFVHPFFLRRNSLRTGSIGATVIREQAGPGGAYTVTGALASFAYTVNLSTKHHLSAALQGGMVNKRLDLSRITTDNQFHAGAFDPSLSHGENIASNATSRPVVNSGFCWTYTDSTNVPKAMLGVAFFNMNRPSYDFISAAFAERVTYTITGEFLLLQRARTSLHPTFRYSSGPTPFANLGVQVRYMLANEDNTVSVGAWYKTAKALVAALQYSTAAYRLSISTDFSAATNTVANINNAIEIGFAWRWKRM